MSNNKYPLVSFFVVAYNEERYIRQAVQSAFNQDYPNLEIILSDDNSPDKTFEIMQEMAANYKGPHTVILNQNVPNLGPRDHYCKVIYELCHGEFVIFSDGDDISAPNRTSVSVNCFLKHPDVVSLSFESQHIDENGTIIPNRFSNGLSEGEMSLYTLDDFVKFDLYNLSDDSRAIRRALIDSFPPLKYSRAEDIFLFARSMYIGSYAYLRQPLVSYRQRCDSWMGKSRAKKNVSSKDIIVFNDTTVRQFKEDLFHAKKMGYIPEDKFDLVSQKIDKLITWLNPSRKLLKNRIARRIVRFLCKRFDV